MIELVKVVKDIFHVRLIITNIGVDIMMIYSSFVEGLELFISSAFPSKLALAKTSYYTWERNETNAFHSQST